MMLPTAPIVDTHCHLDYIERQGREENIPHSDAGHVLSRAMAEGVEFIINPCVSPEYYDQVLKIAEAHDNVYMAVAIHPTDVSDTLKYPDWQSRIRHLLEHPKVVAIGETGLDYYWSTEHIDLQKQCLSMFLKLGVEFDKPVILHDRNVREGDASGLNSHEDILSLVKSAPGVRGIMHCFSGDADFALRMIEAGFYISFAGNITFKKATDLQAAATVVPLEKILVETDSPFLSPMPFRGKMNEPARVRYVVEKIAELKNLSYEEVALATTRNAKSVFGIV
ncbi:MAG: TatD family hydrolase [Vampirovibrionales bacterium]|nr:TatD family hydrolase [Vampirovibrionales bacterium]